MSNSVNNPIKNAMNNLNHYNASVSEREVKFDKKDQKIMPGDVVQRIGNIKEGKIIDPENRIDKLKAIYGEKVLKQMGILECESCQSRTYVDGSNDPSVSFKTPTNISPEASEAAVATHEGEHVANEKAKAQSEDREVVSQSVRTFKAICPECGRMYTSGGVTHTTTQNKPKYNEQKQNFQGQLLDIKV
ncbi:hypothetical protein [Fusibacter ferrireducens]|uniref:Uncharacterized protein n=1 Tax=Fusibacter ferrireducens TaxID=2785058 RepID=A0ABR9ZZU3_9FIRM|nr:hypothetical protein [Fusibacter ferrireducens]MBF4695886.1 hypothetical protein [Fusibacter ferrireducens]